MALDVVIFINCIAYAFLNVFIFYNIGHKDDFYMLSYKRWTAIFSTAAIFIIIANYIVPLSMKMIVIIFMQFAICHLMYNINIAKKMIRVVSVITITSLTDIIISFLFTYTLKVDMINLMENIKYYITYNLLNISFIIVFIVLIKVKKILLAVNDNISGRTKLFLYIIILLQFLSIFVEFFIIFYVARIPNLYFISATSYMCSIISIGLLLYSANIIMDKDNMIKVSMAYSEKLNVYNEVLQNSIEKQRQIAHEHGNQLTVLSGYIANCELEKAKQYLIKIVGASKVDNECIEHIRESGFKALMMFKVAMMEKKNIELETVIEEDIDDTIIPSEDLCNIMGIFLDNAIDAASQTEEPYISLSIFKKEKGLVINVMNTFCDACIDTNKIYNKGYSSKGEGRGYGLYLVDEIIKKYEELDLQTRIEGELFIQELRVSHKLISLSKF